MKLKKLNRKAKFIYLNTTYALYKALNHINPDIVHTANVDADIHGFLATRLLKKTKLVVEEIGSCVDRRPIMRKIHHFIYKRADKVLCVSQDVLNDMRILEGLKRNDVEVTYNPVNVKLLAKSVNSVAEIKKIHSIKTDTFVFGIVARLELIKGHFYLFKAFAKIIEEYPNCSLIVVGAGPLKQDLLNQIKTLEIEDKVIMRGMVQNVGDYLKTFDVFVHPSLKEGFGISIIEAMYMKCPVISGAMGGPLDYIENDINGILVPPKKVEELYRAMLSLLENTSKRVVLGENAKKTVESKFLPTAYAKRIYNIYVNLREY